MATKASRIALAGSNISSTGEVDADLLDNIDSAAFLSLDGNGRLGIGTNDPPSLLSVRKTTTAYEDVISIIGQNSPTDIMGALAYDQATDLMIIRNDQAHATGGIAFRAGGTADHLFIRTDGNVGIGVSSPTINLDITGGAGGIRYTASSGAATLMYSNTSAGYLGTENNYPVVIQQNNSERMRIDTSGNTGIGIFSNLGAKLHVSPTLKVGTYAAGVATGSAVTNSVLCVYSTTNLGTSAGDEVKLLSLSASSGNQSALTFRQRRNADGNNFYTDCYTITQDVDNSEKTYEYMAFSDSKVGIGTDSPGYKLQVDHGTGSEYASSIRNTNDNLQLLLGTTTGGLLNIQGKTINNNTAYDIALQAEGGKVGIGTTSPDRLLDVSGTGNVYGKFQSTNATGAGIQVKDSVEDFLIQADGANDGGLAIYDLGRTTYRWRINSSGVTVPDKLQPSTYEPNIKWVQVTGGFNGSGGTAATSMTWYPITNQSINNYNSDYSGGDRGVNFMIKWTSGNVNRGYHHTVSGHIPILSANAYIGYQNATYSTQASGTSMSEGLNLNICHHTGCASGHNIQCRLFGDGTNYGNIYLQIRAEATPQNGDAYISFWKV